MFFCTINVSLIILLYGLLSQQNYVQSMRENVAPFIYSIIYFDCASIEFIKNAISHILSNHSQFLDLFSKGFVFLKISAFSGFEFDF